MRFDQIVYLIENDFMSGLESYDILNQPVYKFQASWRMKNNKIIDCVYRPKQAGTVHDIVKHLGDNKGRILNSFKKDHMWFDYFLKDKVHEAAKKVKAKTNYPVVFELDI